MEKIPSDVACESAWNYERKAYSRDISYNSKEYRRNWKKSWSALLKIGKSKSARQLYQVKLQNYIMFVKFSTLMMSAVQTCF